MIYFLTVATVALIYAALAVSYSIPAGQVGMLSMSHAVFFSIGAYAYGHLGSQGQDGGVFLKAALVGVLVAAVAASVLGLVILILPDEYVVMVTFSVQIAFVGLAYVLVSLTGGAQGTVGIPAPVIFGHAFVTIQDGLVLAASVLLICIVVAVALQRYPLGLIARASRERPTAAEGAGLRPSRVSIMFFSVGGALASLAGSVFAGVNLYVDPTTFSVQTSVLILAMATVGGLRNPFGAALGAVLVSLVPELLNNLPLDSSTVPLVQQIVYGSLLIAVMLLRPEGLVPERPLVRPKKLVNSHG